MVQVKFIGSSSSSSSSIRQQRTATGSKSSSKKKQKTKTITEATNSNSREVTTTPSVILASCCYGGKRAFRVAWPVSWVVYMPPSKQNNNIKKQRPCGFYVDTHARHLDHRCPCPIALFRSFPKTEKQPKAGQRPWPFCLGAAFYAQNCECVKAISDQTQRYSPQLPWSVPPQLALCCPLGRGYKDRSYCQVAAGSATVLSKRRRVQVDLEV